MEKTGEGGGVGLVFGVSRVCERRALWREEVLLALPPLSCDAPGARASDGLGSRASDGPGSRTPGAVVSGGATSPHSSPSMQASHGPRSGKMLLAQEHLEEMQASHGPSSGQASRERSSPMSRDGLEPRASASAHAATPVRPDPSCGSGGGGAGEARGGRVEGVWVKAFIAPVQVVPIYHTYMHAYIHTYIHVCMHPYIHETNAPA